MSNQQPDEETLFDQALQIMDLEQRASYLDEACDGDLRLRERIESLLTSHERADPYGWPFFHFSLNHCFRR